MPETNQETIGKRQTFLLLFTLQLILRSGNRIRELENIVSKETKEQITPQKTPETTVPKKTVMKPENMGMTKSILSQAPRQVQKPAPEAEVSAVKPVEIKTPRKEISDVPEKMPERVLRIPEPRLPPEFQYLRPTPIFQEIDLDRINPLIYDNAVRIIECQGPDKPLIVSGSMGRKPTSIVLSNQDVEDTIQKFSSASRIPAENGVYKVVVGRLVFSAIISDVVPSKFMIRKMSAINPAAIPRSSNPNYNLFFGARNKRGIQTQ